MRHDARCKLLLGFGLAALVGGTAWGQFAVDRVPPAGAANVPGGLTPVAPTGPSPVVGGYQPAAPSAPVSPGGALYGSTYSPPSAYVPPPEAPRGPTAGGSMYGSPAPASVAPAGTAPAPVPNLAALPMNIEIPTALPKDHPWLLKPEHGAYFIIVKSYVRPAKDSNSAKQEGDKWVSARELAEGLASEIRETHKTQALLFEYISEERKAEMRAYLIAKQKAETEYLAQVRALEQKAQLQGFAWELPDNKLRMRRHDNTDQIGVLVGGFKSEADALKSLAVLKKWEMPKNKMLLDRGNFVRTSLDTKDWKPTSKELTAYINPYESASVVPNPAVAKAVQPIARPGLDPYLVKLNEGCPYNLLKATKGWTLGVKSFSMPVELNKDQNMSLARQSGPSKVEKELVATAQQAESLAKALRAMKGPHGEALNLEAFVLHSRYSSMVTVGQFDAPDDPALLALQRTLSGLMANVAEDPTRPGTGAAAPLFTTMLPVAIPKQ